jgi:hypothetical protein
LLLLLPSVLVLTAAGLAAAGVAGTAGDAMTTGLLGALEVS